MASFSVNKNKFTHILVFLSLTYQKVRCTETYDLNSSLDYLNQTCPSYTGCSGGFFWDAPVLCCIRCSCNSTCVDSHNCCLESQYAPIHSTPYRSEDQRLVCRNTVFIGNSDNIYIHPEYEFIDTCPEFSDDRILKEFCERIELTNRSGIVADNTPVLDKTTGISYGNIYCARCNNIDVANLEAWQPKLVCSKNFDLRAESFGQENGLERLIEYNRCDVSFEPPESFNDVKPCFADVIDACNITGKWMTYNQLDEYHCQNLDLLYVSINNDQNKYKNIFCAICNGENVYTRVILICPFRNTRTTFTMTILLGFSIEEIGIHSSQSELIHTSRDQCPPSFKHDPLMRDLAGTNENAFQETKKLGLNTPRVNTETTLRRRCHPWLAKTMGECRPLYCSPPYHVDISTSMCKLFHRYMETGVIVHPFKLVFQTILHIRDAQTIMETIYDSLYQDLYVHICGIGFFYQTDLIEEDFSMNNFTLSNLKVSSIYLLVHSYITEVNPNEEYDRHTRRFYDHLDHENVVPLDSEYFDPRMLLGDGHEDELDWLRLDYEEYFTLNFDGSPSHYVFTNPYDNTIIIGHVVNIDMGGCDPHVYQRDFLSCTSFLYETANLFNRKQDGLMIEYEGASLVFNFREFKSVNQTTVRVCSDSVITKVQAVSSARHISLDCFALGLVLLFVLFI